MQRSSATSATLSGESSRIARHDASRERRRTKLLSWKPSSPQRNLPVLFTSQTHPNSLHFSFKKVFNGRFAIHKAKSVAKYPKTSQSTNRTPVIIRTRRLPPIPIHSIACYTCTSTNSKPHLLQSPCRSKSSKVIGDVPRAWIRARVEWSPRSRSPVRVVGRCGERTNAAPSSA